MKITDFIIIRVTIQSSTVFLFWSADGVYVNFYGFDGIADNKDIINRSNECFDRL